MLKWTRDQRTALTKGNEKNGENLDRAFGKGARMRQVGHITDRSHPKRGGDDDIEKRELTGGNKKGGKNSEHVFQWEESKERK